MNFINDPKKREMTRRPVGIFILNGRAPIAAYQLYEVTLTSGLSYIVRGSTLQTVPGTEHLNGTKKQRIAAARNLRTDLERPMHAAWHLLESIGNACWDLDAAPLEPKKKKKKRKSPLTSKTSWDRRNT